MSESFAELFEQSLESTNMQVGSIVNAVIVDVDGDWVTVNAGLKSEGIIHINQFEKNEDLTPGAEVVVALESLEDGFGETRLSREKARRAESWIELEKAFEEKAIVKGIINGKVKGGFTVDVNTIRAFLPGSLVDVRPVRDTTHLENKELEFKVIKLDAKRNNVVVSRRAVLEAENSAERDALLENLAEGQEVKGIVKNLTDYGAFVDLGGVDGLLHITDMAFKRIKHPSEVVEVGDEINVKVLKFDRKSNRVSLGLKQLGEDPWAAITQRYPKDGKFQAKVTNLTDYGCFAELEEGVEGLVHVSEMDWTNKNVNPKTLVQVGDEVEVMILDIDEERRRISLGIKQCHPNPWLEFSSQYNKGDKISGGIKSITDFGIFVGLNGGIDGLVHLSDISWNENGAEAVRNFTKGQEVETVILSIDPDRERISLGIKQLESDPFNEYLSLNDKGSLVKGKVISVDAKEAKIALNSELEATLKASELSAEKVEDARNLLNEGDEVEAVIVNVDRKNRVINLSVKAKEKVETEQALALQREKEAEQAGPTTIGDLIKQQMEGGES